MANYAIDLLIGKIWSALENEASSLWGIHDELRELQHELESMKSFLQDAEKRNIAESSELQKTWAESVRNISFDVEDIIDEFTYHMNEQSSRGSLKRTIVDLPKTLWIKHDIASKLSRIMENIKKISDRRQRYSTEGSSTSNVEENQPMMRRESLPYVKDEVVGMDKETLFLKKMLMNQEQQQLIAISIVGMGGSGKTTLAADIYNDLSVRGHFNCHAWISVSQTYARNDLLRRLIKDFYQSSTQEVPELDTRDLKDLVAMLISFLEEKKYLVVLDDVWDSKLWEEIKVALPNNHIGSRIMLTTRQEDVASFYFGVPSHILSVKPLVESDAWSLFCMRAFSRYPKKKCPLEFELLARKLVRKCDGLPLAIATLGALMYSKKSVMEWTAVYNNLNWQLSTNGNLKAIKSILLLSFHDLPYPLKHCFLYCCLFPEDCEFRRKKIIKLWMAEGFIQKQSRITPEEVAESYLMQLTSRNMLQVVQRNSTGRPKACKLHDLIRELFLSISETEKFCATYDGRLPISECEARRLSIQTMDGDFSSLKTTPKLRSLLAFVMDRNVQSSLNVLLSGMKLLRVLDLEDVPIDTLPDQLGYLFNLRYLSLKRSQVAKLPKSIGRLHNLLTLDIVDTRIEVLPNEVGHLRNLRHLIMHRYNYGNLIHFQYVNRTRVLFNISELKNLQAMSLVEAEGEVIKQLRSMTQLTRIGIRNLREADEMNLCSSISSLKLLRSLLLIATDEEDSLGVHALSSPPPHLNRLGLVGKLERLPRWFSSLQSLTYLYLQWSRLSEDSLLHIAELSSLGFLFLVRAFTGEKLQFGRGFFKLKTLTLKNLPELTKITIERGAMPEIQSLYIGFCKELKAVPEGIEYLRNLQELNLAFVCKYLVQNIQGEQSRDRSKVQHITKINCFYPKTQCGYDYETFRPAQDLHG